MTKTDWNPELYLKFDKERIQPSIDLVSRIDVENPEKIIDIGCGPGNSTQILKNRWPKAKITGADNSFSMIEKAKKDYPDQEWIIYDAGKDQINEKFDLVFSNATIQWIPDHDSLLKRFEQLLNKNGKIAIQIPIFWEMPVGISLHRIGQMERWKSRTEDVKDLFTIHESSYYYDQLTGLFSNIEMWQTDYIHVMDSHISILEMIRSTGLRPFLDRLANDKDKNDFEEMVLDSIKSDYPSQIDGKVLFPFKRLFFTANK